MRWLRLAVPLILVFALGVTALGCATGGGEEEDAGVTTSGPDASSPRPDGGGPEADSGPDPDREPDAGQPDAGPPDGGPTCATVECDAVATCDDTSGTPVCTCPDGYTGDGTLCEDIDECAAGTAGCDANATCENRGGSFVCTCDSGFMGDGFTCTDVDECDAGTAGCDVNAYCVNGPGGFMCECDAGFTGDGFTCTDVNECATGAAGCHPLAMCSNTVGSFSCACITGYTGDGFSCSDVNECAAGTAGCDTNASCTNTAGSFSCRCDSGYTGDGFTCADVNECTSGLDNCDANATCTNTPGTFSCACNSGYTGDGVTCTPVGGGCTVVEGFEVGSWPWSPWVAHASGGTVTTSIVHDGSRALVDPGWHYRTDLSVGMAGDRIDAWAYSEGADGRVYFGFDASSGGAKSLILAPNTDELAFQTNSGYGYTIVSSTAYTAWATNRWYRIEVEFQSGNTVVGRLYDSDGTTLLTSVTHTFADSNVGGIAIRTFSGLVVDTMRLCR